ncbi:alpha/beta fold hydrolase [Cellulomonas sp.]|uniref:alpha/beta fold hydrolase n=1 Tax=Cellulomonas sp. TaxID=40001 RepID=UPI003BACEAF4
MSLHTYRADGDGLPVVLLHGFPLDHRMWDDVARLMPPGHPVHAVDLPGTPGHATDLPEPSLEASADLVAEVLRAAGVTSAVIAGLSMGGYVALALLERHPGLVAGLALVDTKSTADAPDARANRLRIADEAESTGSVDPVRPMATSLLGETTRTAQPGVADEVAAWIDQQEPAGIAWSQRAMAARPDRTDVLRAFEGHVVVVVGDEDTVTPVSAAEHLVANAEGARLVVVPQSGHLSSVEQPAAVAAAIAELAQAAR